MHDNTRFTLRSFSQHFLRPISINSHQTSNEQTVRGAVVGLLVLPKLLQTKCLPVQSPATVLIHFQSFVAVLHASIILPLWKTQGMEIMDIMSSLYLSDATEERSLVCSFKHSGLVLLINTSN